MTKKLAPMHPGEVLREEFLVPLKLSPGALARKMNVPRTRIERVAEGTTGITADTALRLAKALGTTAQLWLNLQVDYDLQMANAKMEKIEKIEPVTRHEAGNAGTNNFIGYGVSSHRGASYHRKGGPALIALSR